MQKVEISQQNTIIHGLSENGNLYMFVGGSWAYLCDSPEKVTNSSEQEA